jgi:hypothetical protein
MMMLMFVLAFTLPALATVFVLAVCGGTMGDKEESGS